MTGLMIEHLKKIITFALGEKLFEFSMYSKDYGLHDAIWANGKEYMLPLRRVMENLIEYLYSCADVFLDTLPREDRMERKKHLHSLIQNLKNLKRR